jgi:hypothetical protein
MNKDIIKKHLSETFLNEEAKAIGLKNTETVLKDTDKVNKEYYKDVEKKMSDYAKGVEGEKENTEVTKKYENNDEQKAYHDEVETLNGQEMIDYDNEPSETFKDRAKKAVEGDSTMGNGEGANAEPTFDASSEDFAEDLIDRVKNRKEKEEEESRATLSMGDDIELTGGKPKKKNLSLAENKMKRLRFKKEFNGVENALKLIPESYKVDGKTFQMTDGNENYEIKWEGDINEGKAIILKVSDKELMNEDFDRMKSLMNYDSKSTFGNLKGEERINENKSFDSIWDKTKELLNNTEKKNNK